MTQTKQGISALELGRGVWERQLQRPPGRCNTKLAEVMLRATIDRKPLDGRVEMDDAYLGGERSGGKTWPRQPGQAAVRRGASRPRLTGKGPIAPEAAARATRFTKKNIKNI